MRFKLLLITICLLMPAIAGYIALMSGPTPTASAAPPLTASQQQALISAINALLLTDDDTPETLVLLYINGDNNLAQDMQTQQLVQKIHAGAQSGDHRAHGARLARSW